MDIKEVIVGEQKTFSTPSLKEICDSVSFNPDKKRRFSNIRTYVHNLKVGETFLLKREGKLPLMCEVLIASRKSFHRPQKVFARTFTDDGDIWVRESRIIQKWT